MLSTAYKAVEVKLTAKKRGNSIFVVIPKNVVKELGLEEGTKFVGNFRKPELTVLEELASSGLKFDLPTDELLAEARKGYSKWM